VVLGNIKGNGDDVKATMKKLTRFWSAASTGAKIFASVVPVAGGLIAIWFAVDGSPASSRTGSLEILSANTFVSDGPGSWKALHGRYAQMPRSLPTIRLLVKNTGVGTSVIQGVRVKVERYANLNECYAPGTNDIDAVAPFTVLLPTLPARQASLVTTRHYEKRIEAGQPATLTFRFANGGVATGTGLVQAYELKVQILTDNGTVTSPPAELVTPQGFTSQDPNGAAYLPTFPGVVDVLKAVPWVDLRFILWCYSRNLALIRAFKRLHVRKPSWLSQAPTQVSDPRWLQLVNRLSPSTDAALLVSGAAYAADDAIFAAAIAGDARLVARVVDMAKAALGRVSYINAEPGITAIRARANRLLAQRVGGGAALQLAVFASHPSN
jgi:hypothetical protein